MPIHIIVKSFIVNAFLVVLKLIAGLWFRSAALIADGVHSLSDLISDVFVFIGLKQSTKPPDKEHPFGHGKAEYIISLFIGVSILFVAYQLLYHGITRWGEALTVPSLYSLYVVLIVVVAKAILSKYLVSRGTHIHSQVIIDSGKESFADVISSLVVFVGITSSFFGDLYAIKWLTYGDAIAGIVISLFIVRIAVNILKGAVKSLLGKSATLKIIEQTKQMVLDIDGVQSVDQLTMIVYGHYYQVTIDIGVDGGISVKEGHDIASSVKSRLKENQTIVHANVHVNPKEE